MDRPFGIRRPLVAALALALAVSGGAWSPAARPATTNAAAPTPAARWTFDEGTGTTASDAVGALDGTLLNGTSWITSGAAQGSGAVAFDGVDDAITMPASASLELNSFTLTFWVRGTNQPNTSQSTIIQKGFYGCDAGGSWSAESNINGVYGNVFEVGYPNSTGPGTQFVDPWDGSWHQMALAVDAPAGNVAIWIDGRKSQTSFGLPLNLRYSATGRLDAALRLGSPGADCQYRTPFHGAVDDVRFYSSTLSDAEILALMPVFPTTTTVSIVQSQVTDTVVADKEFAIESFTLPRPEDGTTEFYLAKDGEPESMIGTSPQYNGGEFAFVMVQPNTLAPGSYTAHSKWLGLPNWPASTSAPVTFTVTGRPVALTLTAAPDADVPGGGTTLQAKIHKIDPIDTNVVPGSLEFHDVTGGGDVLLGTAPLSYTGNPDWNSASFPVTSLAAGSHTYEARYAGTGSIAAGTSPTATVVIGPQGSGVSITVTPDPVLNTEGSTAHLSFGTYRKASAYSPNPLPTPTGTLTLKRSSDGSVLGTAPVTGVGQYDLPLPAFPAGTVGLVAEYTGDANFDPATSEVYSLHVQTDVVQATGVKVAWPAFYPYKDGYRDTLPITGTRNEAASVAIKVLNGSNKVVKTFAVPSAGGNYSVAWNGRTSSGAILPAGTYRVVQTLTDLAGMHLVVTSSVTLSTKRLYTYSTVLNKTTPTKKEQVMAIWAFTLPSATVYKSMKFQVYGRSISVPGVSIGAQDTRRCGWSVWLPDCVGAWKTMGYSTAWTSITLSTTWNRYGRGVRGYAYADGSGVAYKARLVVTYGILK